MKQAAIAQAALLFALAVIPAAAEAFYFRDKISWVSRIPASDIVDLDLVRSWGEQVMWVDARPAPEYAENHIPGAICLNEDRWTDLLPEFLGQWSPGKKVVVYCSTKSCNLAGDVARRLKEEAQLKDVYVLEGGWESWLRNRH